MASSKRAVVYARISDDKEGAGLGVERQVADARDLALSSGWAVTGVYADNDFSAFTGKPRPEYGRLCQDIEAGLVDVVLAWHPDRLHRSPVELEAFISLLEATGVTVETVKAGHWDLSTPSGRMVARQLGAVARYESEHKSERTKAKMRQLAEQGKPTGGMRTFGFAADFSIVEDEAALIREAVKRVLAGEGFRSLARDWTERGVNTVRGGAWRTDALRDLLRNPKLAGHQTYGGEIAKRNSWRGIITDEEHGGVVAVVERNAQAHRGRSRPARTRLLPGFLVCGRCGQPMIGARKGPAEGHRAIYRCRPATEPGHPACCGRVVITGDRTDGLVRDMVLAALEGPALARAVEAATGDDERQRRASEDLARDRAALEQLTQDHYVAGIIGREEFLAARQPLEARVQASRALLRPQTRAGVLARLRPGSLRQVWDEGSLDMRRAIIGAVVEKVVVKPVAHRGMRWSPERIEIVWRA